MTITPIMTSAKDPLVAAFVMYAPRPVATRWCFPKLTTSATIDAFQAPPAAVMPPVT